MRYWPFHCAPIYNPLSSWALFPSVSSAQWWVTFFGVIALSGVVVNDSLIMVDFINSAIARGENILKAVVDSGCLRFRAILLTSLTTFFGLLPMLLESSVQAQFVIPMAVSLGFGIIFATVITLILIPCLYIVLEDVKHLIGPSSAKSLIGDSH